jgi:multidrug efflux pump subunit AcrA (membrane-fusion protein)
MIKGLKLMVIMGVSVALITSLTGCSLKTNNNNRSVPALVTPIAEQLQTVPVKKGSIGKIGTTTGRVVSITDYELVFKNKSGYLGKINVNAGDTVKKGQVIAQMETEDLKYEIKQAELDYELDKLNYEASKDEVSRIRLEKTKLRLQQLKDNLKGTTLTAPIGGKVIYVTDIRVGQRIMGDEPIVVIADPSGMQVQCDGRLSDFKIGNKTSMKIEKEIYEGEIVSNTVLQDLPGAPIRIFIKFLSNSNGINLGDVVDVTCTFMQKDDVLLVPKKAVKTGEGSHPYLRIKEKDDVSERYIETGLEDNAYVEVISGVTEGELVIIN